MRLDVLYISAWNSPSESNLIGVVKQTANKINKWTGALQFLPQKAAHGWCTVAKQLWLLVVFKTNHYISFFISMVKKAPWNSGKAIAKWNIEKMKVPAEILRNIKELHGFASSLDSRHVFA